MVICATPTVVNVDVVIIRATNISAFSVPLRGLRMSAQPLPAAADTMITK